MDDYFLLKAIYENREKILELNPMFCNDVQFGNDFELMFYTYSDSSHGGIMLGFQDYRVEPIVKLQYYYMKDSEKPIFLASENANPSTTLLKPESFNHTFINEPVKHFIPFKLYSVHHPRKFIATKTETNFWDNEIWSNSRTMIPLEYTEIKSYDTQEIDKDKLRIDLDEEIPKFIHSIKAKINHNTIFLNSSGWKKKIIKDL